MVGNSVVEMAKADWNIEAKKVSVRRILARNSFNES
jgi:hypothetical protein